MKKKRVNKCYRPIPGRLTRGSLLLFFMVLVTGLFTQPLSAQDRPTVTLSREDLSGDDQAIPLSFSWKYHPGDNLDWASLAVPDSSWEQINTALGPAELPFMEWEGIGWFRIHFQVDSSLVNQPLGLILEQHRGASEIYLDGELLYELGQVSIFEEDYQPRRSFRPVPFTIQDTTRHLLAIRYANHDTELYSDYGFTAGFRLLVGELNYHIEASIEKFFTSPWAQLFYAGGLLAFTIIHFLLYLFYPSKKKNLYFALFTGFLALLTYTILESEFTSSPIVAIRAYRLHLITGLLTVIYALRFTYSLYYNKTPVQFWFFLGSGLLLAAATWFNATVYDFYREVFVFLTIIELSRVLIISFYRRKEGIWIISLGLAGFVAGILFAVLANLNIITFDPLWGSLYGSVILIFSMSIYLSREFARTHKRLEHKLIEVKQLSERSLQQERINKQKELERKLLEAENERKSKELEEARALQLSMLPRQIPNSDYWDISVFMETAQEVGGDYYDFSLSKNGEMTVVLGDATGHGMKAGIMVATAKSYFHTLADEHGNLGVLKRMSSGIRNMDLKMMFMGLMLVKCKKHQIQITSAGMPPALLYRHAEDEVHDIIIKGMPLGSKAEYPYEEREMKLSEGDTFLLMSDGLMELFNENNEMLGMEKIKRAFHETADSSASDILSQLTKLVDQWSGSATHRDDITILVLKAKNKS